jgi:hypothetical protein
MTTELETRLSVVERGSVDIEVGPELDQNARPTPAGWRFIGRKFREPMPTRSAKKPGGARDYITARQVQERLDAIVGPGNWASDLRVVRSEHPVAVAVGICVYGVWKWDVGYSNNPDQVDEYVERTDQQGKRVVDEVTGEVQMRRNPAFEDEPLKAATSDGFKRAGVAWGVGRFLYPEMH